MTWRCRAIRTTRACRGRRRKRTLIFARPDRREYELSWPRVLRISVFFARRLREPKWSKMKPLEIRGSDTPLNPEMAALLDSRAPTGPGERLNLQALERQYRMQTLAFQAAASVARDRAEEWGGEPGALAAQLVSFAENFIQRLVRIRPKLPPGEDNDRKKRLLLGLNFDRILRHFADAVEADNMEETKIVLDMRPTGSTGDMRPWYTGRPCVETRKSHINCCPYDGNHEAVAAEALDRMDGVRAWVKNDHLGFEIFWSDGGVPRKYRPDFLVELQGRAETDFGNQGNSANTRDGRRTESEKNTRRNAGWTR